VIQVKKRPVETRESIEARVLPKRITGYKKPEDLKLYRGQIIEVINDLSLEGLKNFNIRRNLSEIHSAMNDHITQFVEHPKFTRLRDLIERGSTENYAGEFNDLITSMGYYHLKGRDGIRGADITDNKTRNKLKRMVEYDSGGGLTHRLNKQFAGVMLTALVEKNEGSRREKVVDQWAKLSPEQRNIIRNKAKKEDERKAITDAHVEELRLIKSGKHPQQSKKEELKEYIKSLPEEEIKEIVDRLKDPEIAKWSNRVREAYFSKGPKITIPDKEKKIAFEDLFDDLAKKKRTD